MRIGLISDTHFPEACDHLPSRVFEVFRGADLVMHAGDVYVNRVLDELAEIAPVIAALGSVYPSLASSTSAAQRFAMARAQR